jgi:hypothetical protein
MKFRVTEVIAKGEPSKMAHKIIAFLNKFPDGKLLTTLSLAKALNYKAKSIRDAGEGLGDYKCQTGRGNFWGNKKTIKQFKKQLNEN